MAEPAPADTTRTDSVTAAEVTHVIVRACRRCRHPRQIDTPCAGCGLGEPPEVTELGVVSATYRNPLKQFWWAAVGQRLAHRRIERANRRALQLRAKE